MFVEKTCIAGLVTAWAGTAQEGIIVDHFNAPLAGSQRRSINGIAGSSLSTGPIGTTCCIAGESLARTSHYEEPL